MTPRQSSDARWGSEISLLVLQGAWPRSAANLRSTASQHAAYCQRMLGQVAGLSCRDISLSLVTLCHQIPLLPWLGPASKSQSLCLQLHAALLQVPRFDWSRHLQGLDLLVFLEGHTQLSGEGTGIFRPTAWEELMRLINGSSLTVTEDMPTSPYARWLQVSASLSSLLSGRCCGLASTSLKPHCRGWLMAALPGDDQDSSQSQETDLSMLQPPQCPFCSRRSSWCCLCLCRILQKGQNRTCASGLSTRLALCPCGCHQSHTHVHTPTVPKAKSLFKSALMACPTKTPM